MALDLKNFAKISQFEVSCKISYLIGVPQEFISKEPVMVDMYETLDRAKWYRIIRNLCIVRTGILRNSGKIQVKMSTDYVRYTSFEEYINQDAVKALIEDDVDFYKESNKTLDQHLIEINKIISDKINNCKDLFPIWLEWDYVRDLFIMPDGLTSAGIYQAKQKFFKNRIKYPYQMYLNWDTSKDFGGNILRDDKTIVPIMYEMHNKEFNEWNRVEDIGENTKNGIYSYIENSKKVVIAVDCENSDPYKMCAALRSLDSKYVSKISKIILVDDVNASSAWKFIEGYIGVPVEYSLIPRIKKCKSLVDITLATVVCKEHYTNDVDSFIMLASDSDYWGATTVLPDVNFLFMVERDSTAHEFKEALRQVNIPYCYLDDFYSGSTTEIKFDVISKELINALQERSIDANALFKDAIKTTRAELTEVEYSRFFKKFFGKLTVSMSSEGIISVKSK